MAKCKHCSHEDCYAHCQEAEDGKHIPDPKSANLADGADPFVIDFNCIKCGGGGATRIDPNDIQWE